MNQWKKACVRSMHQADAITSKGNGGTIKSTMWRKKPTDFLDTSVIRHDTIVRNHRRALIQRLVKGLL
jgi:hypothetical protein